MKTIYPDNPKYPTRVRQFLDAVQRLSIAHGLSISHEDNHGGFQIEKYDERNITWLKQAATDVSE